MLRGSIGRGGGFHFAPWLRAARSLFDSIGKGGGFHFAPWLRAILFNFDGAAESALNETSALRWNINKLQLCLVLFFILALVPAERAWAYVDPSVMTYTIQAIAGVAVALSAVIGVAFRRSRKLIFKLFKIDENAGKLVEPQVVAFEGNGGAKVEDANAQARKDKTVLQKGTLPRPLPYKQRLVRALLGCGFLVFTLYVVSSLTIVAASASSLYFKFYNVVGWVLLAGAAATAILGFALAALKGRAFDRALTGVVALGLCCYIQAIFFNGPLPPADGYPMNIMNFKTITVISGAVWLAIIAGLLVLNAKKLAIARGLVCALSAALILVQAVDILAINPGKPEYSESTFNGLSTSKGLYELSENQNILVFVLDIFDTRNMKELLEKQPDALKDFTGFTWYQNATGAMAPTRYGIPYLLSGKGPNPGDSFEGYLNSRYAESEFIPTLAKAGFDIGIYTDSLRTDRLTPLASNLVPNEEIKLNLPGLLPALLKVSLFRDAPWILKPLFWFYTDQINNAAIDPSMAPYHIDDPKFYKDFQKEGLSIGENDKVFRFIHLLGAHYPFVMNENAEYVGIDKSTQQAQIKGILKVVDEYLQAMRDKGIYDKSTIIITADHGDWYWHHEPLKKATGSLLMIKPGNETPEQAAAPIKVSKAPVGSQDFSATVIDAAGLDSKPFGRPVRDYKEGESRERPYWDTRHEEHLDMGWDRYIVSGEDANDFSNWRETGDTIPIERHD